jgi:hypothetical protein
MKLFNAHIAWRTARNSWRQRGALPHAPLRHVPLIPLLAELEKIFNRHVSFPQDNVCW